MAKSTKRRKVAGGGRGLLPSDYPLAGQVLVDIGDVMQAAQDNGDNPQEAAADYLALCARGRPDLSHV